MKKFTLSADFMKWDPADENSSESDSFDYVIDLESEEEARTRLDTLIIERMSSRPGWSYKLTNSSFAEFPISDDEESIKVIYDIPLFTTQTEHLDVTNPVGQSDISTELLSQDPEIPESTSDLDQRV